jgi:hypothetical protein
MCTGQKSRVGRLTRTGTVKAVHRHKLCYAEHDQF